MQQAPEALPHPYGKDPCAELCNPATEPAPIAWGLASLIRMLALFALLLHPSVIGFF